MTFLRRAFFGCWWEHGDMLRDRVKGRYVLRCDVCGTTKAFPKQKLRLLRTERGTAKALTFPRRISR